MYEYDNKSKFDSIEVTLAMGCRLNCKYCPQKLLLGKYYENNPKRNKIMRFADFKIIIERVKKGGTICFSGMCEAFHNPECAEMIMYAYEQGYKITLLTTLMGADKAALEKLKNVEFDGITLHIPDKQGNSRFDISNEYLECLKYFHEHFEISSYSCHGDIHPEIAQYVDKNIVLSSQMIDRAGNLEMEKHYTPKGEIVCMVGTIGQYGNWTPEVLPDGTVVLCCMDYGMQHVLGNLITMTAEEIINEKEYQKIVEGMKNECSHILCRKCSGAMEIDKTPAYKLKKVMDDYRCDKKNVDDAQRKVAEKICSSEKLCIYGLGKLFWNNFFNQKWNDVLLPNYLCDVNVEYVGKTIEGIQCIGVDELKNIENCLVIVHVADAEPIKAELRQKGITNVISIQEIYNEF